jgi:hypothetical protein
MDKQEMLKNFLKVRDHKRFDQSLNHIIEYVADLEAQNDKLRAIVADPEAEIHRCREELRTAEFKLRLQDAYSISSEERLEGHKWLMQHNDDFHDGLDDHHWEISPFELGINVAIVCDQCGGKYCVRTD